MTDRYRQALEGLRERCAQEAERITARRRVIAAMANNEAMKPCKIAFAIRKIDVQQYYEGARAGLEMERAKNEEIAVLREALRRVVLHYTAEALNGDGIMEDAWDDVAAAMTLAKAEGPRFEESAIERGLASIRKAAGVVRDCAAEEEAGND